MPVPGMTPKIEPTAKVRIGEKRTSKSGKQYPAAVDYFACPGIIDGKPSTIRISFVHASRDEAFSNGLEWWVKTSKMARGALACYTKDGSSDPTALRLEAYLGDAEKRSDKPVGTGRFAIKCPARECPILKRGDCKPMGRLVFVLDGRREVLQIDTKSWNSIELIEGALKRAEELGPLNTPGRTFDLSVQIVKKGSDQFPVMSIQEVAVPLVVNDDASAGRADALVAIENGIEAGLEDRVILANALDHFKPDWREDAAYIARIREIGPNEALQKMRERLGKEAS